MTYSTHYRQPTLHTALLALGLAAYCALGGAQNVVQAAKPNVQQSQSADHLLSAGTALTETVLKTTLPVVNMQPGTPNDPATRVSEPAHYQGLQTRINMLKLKSPLHTCMQQYHLAKSQAWLNFSRDQYHENVWQQNIQTTTFEEAQRIVSALETKTDPGMDTPLLSEAVKIRPDLWAKAETIKRQMLINPAGCCASLETAFCEVQLVWAGHALANLGGWKRANGHVRMAEDLCQEASTKMCAAPPALSTLVLAVPPFGAPNVAPLPEPVLATAVPRRVSLKTQALFYHDKHTAAGMLPQSKTDLNALVQSLTTLTVDNITLTGYADVSNSTGDRAYNTKLSLKRADTVRAYLQGLLRGSLQGLLQDRGLVFQDKDVQHRSDTWPAQNNCTAPKGGKGALKGGGAAQTALADYYACLQPSRRVEIEVSGVQRL